jgi:ribonuclease HI
MRVPTPHYLLFSAGRTQESAGAAAESCGKWEFLLESLDGKKRVKVVEQENEVAGQRLELLAVVRGLEALDQPSRVTLMTASNYVVRGLRCGLPQWREDNWQWESFGQMVPIRNADLWRRLDRAMHIHRVRCRALPADIPTAVAAAPRTRAPRRTAVETAPARRGLTWLVAFAARLRARFTAWFEQPPAATRLCIE